MRGRMLVWLVLVILPSVAVSWFTVGLVDQRLSDRIAADLTNVRRLEAARISDALFEYERSAQALADGAHVKDFVAGVDDARRGIVLPRDIGGFDGFDVVDPNSDAPLNQLAFAVQKKAQSTGSEIVELRIIGSDGSLLGETLGFTWEPYDPSVVDAAIAMGQPAFGNAFRTVSGDHRIALVVPINNDAGVVTGALEVEARLGPIVDLVVEHEGFGETSEAHIAQPTAEGDAEFITLLRFERTAAFNKVVPKEKGLPINQALDSPEGALLRSPDYRSIESVLSVQTLDATGWGLVVKIDSSEAFAPVQEVIRVVALAGLVTIILIVVGWWFLLQPLGRRLRRLSTAATEVAAGRYKSSIGDKSTDEIGDLARSIDRLAADLDADIQMRALVEEKLRHQVSHDHLTGIHNREFAAEEIRRLSSKGTHVCSVLFLDLDSFKSINDTYGHSVGDEVLRAVAGRLQNADAEQQTVARWGGDEFVILLPGADPIAARVTAQNVQDLFLQPVSVSVGELNIRCSVGIATTDSERSIDEVMLDADLDMFAQKPTQRDKRRRWPRTERIVASALKEDRIEVWYQPILTSDPGEQVVVGAEALVRIRSSDGVLVPPLDFIPAIARNEIGLELDDRVGMHAARTAATWLNGGMITDEFQMSVNMCAASVADHNLPSRVSEILIGSGLPAHMLVIEISETAGQIDPELMKQLGDLGVLSAVDDVGISNSNFDRLLEVCPSIAKLDRRWLAAGGAAHAETQVLGALIRTCRTLGFQTVAEGVETPAQHKLVHSLGVSHVQGFLFGPPVDKVEFERQWLPSHVPSPAAVRRGG